SCLSPFFIILSLIVFAYILFKHTATTEIYTLSLHDALPICVAMAISDILTNSDFSTGGNFFIGFTFSAIISGIIAGAFLYNQERSEEHTSELQSRFDLVCRLLLEKKKKNKKTYK